MKRRAPPPSPPIRAPPPRAAAGRATSLRPLDVTVSVAAATVTVTIGHRSVTDVALIGRLIADVDLRASATMALEPP